MKTVRYFERWIPITFGLPIEGQSPFGKVKFEHFSNKVSSGVDSSLSEKQKNANYDGVIGWFRKNWYWRNCVILNAVGNPNTTFMIGYCYDSKYSVTAKSVVPQECKIAPPWRQVKDGVFAMRIPNKKCEVFIVGDGKLELEVLARKVDRNSHEGKGKYKRVKIY